MTDTQAFRELVARVGEFYITEKAMKNAQRKIESALADGEPGERERDEYLAAVRRYFTGFEREARSHLRDVDKRLEHVNQVHFNLTAERGVAVRRIEATKACSPTWNGSPVLNETEGRNAANAVERAGMGALEQVGRKVNSFFEYIGGITALGGETVKTVARLRIRFAETVNQCFLLGYQSLIIVLLTSLFTGMVFSLESAVQAVQYGFGNFVGGIVSYTNVRELGPMLTAVVVAGRVCAAIAAEIGSMVVTEQVEALQSLGLAPVRFLVVPRVLALMIMLPLLTVFADVVGVMGGQWIAHAQAHISYDDFMSSARQTIGFEDVVKGLFKSVIFGIIIALVGSYQGLTTKGGAAGVGKSTTSAVVICIIMIFIINFVMSYFLYGGG